MALTDLEIKNLKSTGKIYHKADGGGLSIEVSSIGSKLWRYRYRFNNKQQVLALGKYPQVSLSEARKKRDEARELVQQGKHPTREKKAKKLRQEHEGQNTFKVIAMRWMEIKKLELNEKYHKQNLARLEQHVFPIIGDLPVTEIKIPDIVCVVEKISQQGTIETAKRMKQLVSQIFRYATHRGLCEHNPASDLRDILPKVERKHHSCIPISELPDLLREINDYKGDIIVKLAIKFLTLTFVRTRELIEAEWQEIDLNRAEWHIPKEHMKMKQAHFVPLSDQAIEILNELKSITGNRTHIFYSARSKTRHISNGAVLMALRRMGYQGRMTGHGFRTLASTILNEQGHRYDIIERQLAHAEKNDIRAAYNRAEYLLERKKLMQDWASFLDRAMDDVTIIEGVFNRTIPLK